MRTLLISILLSSMCLPGSADGTGPVSIASIEAGATPAVPSQTDVSERGHASSVASAQRADDPATFVPAGATVVDVVRGDLTGQGTSDALVVFSSGVTVQRPFGDGPARTVLLLLGDGSGRLQKVAENARIIPCEACGGMAGDPYAYAHIEAGSMTLAVAGGSRQRWFHDYEFRYAPARSIWQLQRVVRGVTDTRTDLHKQAELTFADFGEVDFADFDPASLPPAPALD